MEPSATKVSAPTYRRILKTLLKAQRGCDVNALLSLGFKFATISDIVRAGLAAAQLETANVGGRTVEIARIRITDAGRQRLELKSASRVASNSEPALAVPMAEADTSTAEALSDLEAELASPYVVEIDAKAAITKRDPETALAVVTQQIVEGKARIRIVRASITRRRELGLSTDLAEDLLNTMLASLSLMRACQAQIEATIEHGSVGQE